MVHFLVESGDCCVFAGQTRPTPGTSPGGQEAHKELERIRDFLEAAILEIDLATNIRQSPRPPAI
jgi:hypothetical protein